MFIVFIEYTILYLFKHTLTYINQDILMFFLNKYFIIIIFSFQNDIILVECKLYLEKKIHSLHQ